MKKFVSILAALLAFGTAQAQMANLKVAVVDMADILNTHYKTEEQNAKLKADQDKAKDEIQKLNDEGNALVAEYKDLQEQSNNATLTAEAKNKLQSDIQSKAEEIQRKQNEVNSFRQNTERSFQQRIKTFRDILLEEISKAATDIAKSKGATLVLDKSGPSALGISPIIYSDASFDITEAVRAEVNKGRPADAPAAAAAKDSKPAADTSSDSAPKISFPGSK